MEIPHQSRFARPKSALPFRSLLCLVASLALFSSSFAQVTRTSVQSGNWSNKNTWNCSCVPSATNHVVITSGHAVNFVGGGNTMASLTVQSGASVTDNGSTTTITGNLTVNGTYGGTGITALTGANAVISGLGTITNTGSIVITGNKSIASTTSITKTAGNIVINANSTVTNNGNITIGGAITAPAGTAGSNAGWINAAGSTLRIGGAGTPVFPGTDVRVFDASATGNTVIYTGTSAQNIVSPTGSQYWNISFTGGGVKTLPASTILVAGNMHNESPMAATGGTVNFNGTTVITGNAPLTFNNVVTTGSLTAYEGQTNIGGNFTDNGTFNANNGTVVFTGSSVISGSSAMTSFENINVSSTLSNEKSTELFGLMNVNAGATFDADGSGAGIFTLRSVSELTSDDASIGTLAGGAAVTGTVRIERFMSNRPRIYRYISSPVKNALLSSWSDNFHITGYIPGLTRTTICGYSANPTSPSLFSYDESLTGSYIAGYRPFPALGGAGLNSPIVPGRGYVAYIRNCTEVVLNVDGEINSGDIAFDFITYNNHGDVADGINLVGNPYPSAVDWASATGWQRQSVGNIAIVSNNTSGALQWEYLDAAEVGNPQVIASGQAFWVQATGSGVPSLTINETAKTTSAGSFYREDNKERDHLIVTLTDGVLRDRAFTKLRPMSSTGRDEYDGLKLQNEIFNVFTFSPDEYEMAINSTPVISCEQPVKIGIRNLKSGKYTLSLETLGKFNLYTYYLKDAYTDTVVKLDDLTYGFSVTKEPGSFAVDRFALLIEQKTHSAPVVLKYDPVICSGAAEIAVLSSIDGIGYNAFDQNDSLVGSLTGTGSDLIFTFNQSLFEDGSQKFRIQSVLACGMEGASEVASIAVSETPSGWEVLPGKTCGPGPARLELMNLKSDYEVFWYKKENDEIPAFKGAIFITPTLKKTETWFTQVKNVHGCYSQRFPVVASVVYVEAPVVDARTGQTLASPSPETIWYLDGEIIGSGQEIIVSESGVYTAEVVNSGCSATTSYTMVIEGHSGRSDGNRRAYPNPLANFINIPTENGGFAEYITIQDVKGSETVIYPLNEFNEGDQVFSVAHLSPGMYVVKSHFAKKVRVEKMVKK